MKRLLKVLLILFPLLSYGEEEEFSIGYLGVESGLSNNHVVGITQDKNGFMWIATDEGLNRFDGHNFKTFYKDDIAQGSGLTGNELNAIIDDPERPIVWIATQRAGLNAYNYETGVFTAYRHSPEDANTIATDDVTSIAPAADGGIWITTFSAGVDHLDPETGKFTHYNKNTVKGLPDASVWGLSDGGDGLLYLAHEFDGLSIVDKDKMIAKNYKPDPAKRNSIPSSHLKCVYKDLHDNIWLGTGAGLVLYNPDEENFINFGDIHPELRHSVDDVKQFSGNHLWVAMERGGIAILDLNDTLFSNPAKSACRVLQSDFGNKVLSSPSVRSLYEDDFSNVWAGSWGGGVNLISPHTPAFRHYPLHKDSQQGEITSANSVLTIVVDNDNRIWIGTDGGMLEKYDSGRREAIFSKQDGTLPGSIVQSSFKTPDGSLWFGFFNEGACRFDPDTDRFERIFPADSKVDVRDITSDRNGDLLFGSSSGVWRYHHLTRKLEGPFTVGNNLIRKIYPLDNGNFLVGTFGSGLIVVDGNLNECHRYDVNSGFPSNTVNDIFCSRDGKLFIASGEGLIIFNDYMAKPDKFDVLNRASGLENTHVLAVTQDRSGTVWISTNGGISCIKNEKIFNYSHRDHVPIGNFLGHSVACDRQGNLYFGAISGLCMFNPVKVLEAVENPSPVIVELVMLESSSKKSDSPMELSVAGKTEVKLHAGQNSFDIVFTSRNFALTREVEYAYMLEGLEDRWLMARNGNIATFRDLSPGKYTFKVKTRVRNQDWGEPAVLKIVIPPPFYLSWWAETIYVLCAVYIVVCLLYLYRKRLNSEAQLKAEEERYLREQELNNERLRFYTNITHELRTPLTLIVGPLEDLTKSENLPDKDRKSLIMVHRNAARLLDLVNRLLEFRKTETQNRRLSVRRGNIAATVYEVALKYKELNRNRKVTVHVSTESGDMQAVFDKEVITVVLDNLISNSLKYTNWGGGGKHQLPYRQRRHSHDSG